MNTMHTALPMFGTTIAGRRHPAPLGRRRRPIATLGLLLGLATIAPSAARAHATDPCGALRDLALDDATITSATTVEADTEKGLPAYCRVRASVPPAIGIEVRLPLENWNGKLYQVGCGGGCGVLGRADRQGHFINAMGPGLARGYATATSDGGHHALDIFDLSWAHHDPAAERDWTWRALDETYRVAQALIEAFHDAPPTRSYFQGCSTGGRLAHVAALRFPEHFDGIISGAPALDQAGLAGVFGAWVTQANTGPGGEPLFRPGKASLLGNEVLRQCDGIDGKVDGLIDDPRECSVDLSTLACTDGTDDCLSADEIDVARKWYDGPRDGAGEALYPDAVPAGSEPFWWLWLTGREENPGGGLLPRFAEGFLRYMAFEEDPGPSLSLAELDIEKALPRLREHGARYAVDSVELGPFREAGGKLIVWHGWADAIVPPRKTLHWHDALVDAFGEPAADEFVRLFMIPGMDHCGVLPDARGLDQFGIDPLTALEDWVERGEAPESIMR